MASPLWCQTCHTPHMPHAAKKQYTKRTMLKDPKAWLSRRQIKFPTHWAHAVCGRAPQVVAGWSWQRMGRFKDPHPLPLRRFSVGMSKCKERSIKDWRLEIGFQHHFDVPRAFGCGMRIGVAISIPILPVHPKALFEDNPLE